MAKRWRETDEPALHYYNELGKGPAADTTNDETKIKISTSLTRFLHLRSFLFLLIISYYSSFPH